MINMGVTISGRWELRGELRKSLKVSESTESWRGQQGVSEELRAGELRSDRSYRIY